MATFPSITPAYGETQTIEQDNIVVKLGDGYEQRLVRGLAANKRYHVISLVFNISQSRGRVDIANGNFSYPTKPFICCSAIANK